MPARCCIVLMTREVATVKTATHASWTRIANWNESCWKIKKKKRILQRTCALRLLDVCVALDAVIRNETCTVHGVDPCCEVVAVNAILIVARELRL